jgi:nitrate reductase / nitrite oxidoreductase, beta subunit
MVWYVPPLSPFTNVFEGKDMDGPLEAMFPAISQMRIPLDYLANLLSAGDKGVIMNVLQKMVVMRHYMRAKTLGKMPSGILLEKIGMTPEVTEEMYRLLAIAKYEDRFVIPPAHKEHFSNLYNEQGATGYDFDCHTCKVGE